MRHTVVVCCLTIAALAGLAGTAPGGQTDRASFDLTLTRKAPRVPTGVKVDVVFKDPDDPQAKPPALDSAVITAPRGIRINDDAVPKCMATDDEFQASGRDACPEETQVGSGAVIVMTGVPGMDPSTLDLVAFNGDGELVEVVFFGGTNVVAGIDRVTIEGNRLTAHPPNRPGGPPDGRVAIRELHLSIPRRVGEDGHAYIRNPRRCRATRHWRSSGRFEFADGGETTVTSRTPCRHTRRR